MFQTCENLIGALCTVPEIPFTNRTPVESRSRPVDGKIIAIDEAPGGVGGLRVYVDPLDDEKGVVRSMLHFCTLHTKESLRAEMDRRGAREAQELLDELGEIPLDPPRGGEILPGDPMKWR